MKKAVLVLTTVLALSSVAAPSYATGSHFKDHHKSVKVVEIKTSVHNFFEALLKKLAKHKKNHHVKPTPSHQVPEIDTGSAALVLALMGGIAAVRQERRRKS